MDLKGRCGVVVLVLLTVVTMVLKSGYLFIMFCAGRSKLCSENRGAEDDRQGFEVAWQWQWDALGQDALGHWVWSYEPLHSCSNAAAISCVWITSPEFQRRLPCALSAYIRRNTRQLRTDTAWFLRNRCLKRVVLMYVPLGQVVNAVSHGI